MDDFSASQGGVSPIPHQSPQSKHAAILCEVLNMAMEPREAAALGQLETSTTAIAVERSVRSAQTTEKKSGRLHGFQTFSERTATIAVKTSCRR